jgi:proton glutamate symport protein
VVAAASGSAFLSLIVFTLAFAFAVTRIAPEGRARIVGLFAAVRDATLVLIDWILWLAPLGVFALAFGVGAKAGLAAFGALVHYIVVISAVGVVITLLAYVMGSVGGRMSPVRFARALLPIQAVAVSTQSSLACLPAMLRAAEGLGVPERTAGVALPLAVAMFRATQPPMNIAICLYIAHWFGIPVAPGQLVAAVAVGALVSLGSVSLPAQITLFASVAPPAVVLGLPLTPIGLFLAVETIPDIFRTLGNASMDLAATVAVSARDGRGGSHEVSEPGA